MPRKREHDPLRVTLGLIEVFRERGYEGASFSDLAKATGLDRAQLSREYGDKRQLFLIALQEMHAVTTDHLNQLRKAGDIDDIRKVLKMIGDQTRSDDGRLGCLMCNSFREPIAADPEVAEVLQDHLRQVEAAYRGALRNTYRARGLSVSRADLRQKGRLLLGVHVSLMVLLRAGESRAVLADIAAASLDGLGLSQ